jgi:hypothetical protein
MFVGTKVLFNINFGLNLVFKKAKTAIRKLFIKIGYTPSIYKLIIFVRRLSTRLGIALNSDSTHTYVRTIYNRVLIASMPLAAFFGRLNKATFNTYFSFNVAISRISLVIKKIRSLKFLKRL